MGLLESFARSKLLAWTTSLTPGAQLSRRAWVDVTYTPAGGDEGKDISEDLMKYLMSVEYTENLADFVDDLTITLEDKAAMWQADWFPEMGAKLTVTLHTLNNYNLAEGMLAMPLGTFEIDQIEVDAPPSTVQIKAVKVTLDGTLRGDKVNKKWENVDIKTIAKDIADKNKLEVEWYGQDPPTLDHVEQSDESDCAFLRKLCKDNGYNLRVTDKSLIIYDEGKLESVDAKIIFSRPKPESSMPIYKISLASGDAGGSGKFKVERFFSYRMTAKTRDIYKACHVKCKQTKKKEVIEATFNAPNMEKGKTLEINSQVKTQAEAERLAKRKLRDQNKDQMTCTFNLYGDLLYYAGQTIEISKFGKFDGKYIVTKVTHHLGTSYTLDIDMRKCLDGY